MNRRNPIHCQQGFTLVELITVVILVSVLSVLGGMLITTPIRSFIDLSRRAELVDIADNALQRMSREIRNALPNSVRVSNSGMLWALEFLNTTTGGRYRARQEAAGTGDPLDGEASDSFDVLGGMLGPINVNSDRLVIYNTGIGAGYFNAYNGDNIALITAATGASLTYSRPAPFPFPIPPSASQRFYVVEGPISYVCDLSTGQLSRYAGYGIGPVQPVPPAGTGDLLANNVQNCVFSYTGAPGARYGLVSLRIEVSVAGESVALQYQVHVVNVP